MSLHLCITVLRSNCRWKGGHHALQAELFCCSFARSCHDLNLVLAVLLKLFPCNGLPRRFEAFSHSVKLTNKDFVLVSTVTTKILVKKQSLEISFFETSRPFATSWLCGQKRLAPLAKRSTCRNSNKQVEQVYTEQSGQLLFNF